MLNVAVVSLCENKNQPVVGIQNMDNNNVFVISPKICIDNAGHICQTKSSVLHRFVGEIERGHM